MTPLHEGSLKPVRGADGEMKADKKAAINTLSEGCQSGKTPQPSNDGARPFKIKKRARRRQKSRSSGLSGRPHKGSGKDGAKANSSLPSHDVQAINGAHAKAHTQIRNGRPQPKNRHTKSDSQPAVGNRVTYGAQKVSDTQELRDTKISNGIQETARHSAHNSKINTANHKKRRRKRPIIARANVSLQPAIIFEENLNKKDNHHKANQQNTHLNDKNTLVCSSKNHNDDKQQITHAHNHNANNSKFYLQRGAKKQSLLKNKQGNTNRSRGFEKQVGLLGVDDQLIAEINDHDHNKHLHGAHKAHHGGLYAALDLGTNNCRLLIASPTRPGYFRVIDAFSRIVRLGEGLSRQNRLSETAMHRAIEALKVCASKLSQCNISHQRLIATEACRSAENGEQFIAQVKQETGLELEIVNRETEARLAVSGCGTLVEPETEAIVLFDIGGGSSEIALIDVSHRRSPRLADHIIAWTSLPVGVVTLAERFGGVCVTANDFLAMKNHVSDLLKKFHDRKKLGALVHSQGFHLLGTSGTVTTLAGIHLKLERYDRRRIDGMWMQSAEVDKMTQKLLSWNMSERVANPCIGADRADLVLAGCAILEAIRDIWPSGRLRVADRGLREGILTELMSHSGAWRKKRYARRQNNYDKVHTK